MELIVTVAIVAIIATVATPALSTLMRNNRLSTENFQFIKALKYARSQAITLKQNIVVASISGTQNWATGWTITDAAGNVLQQSNGFGNGSVFTQDQLQPSIVFTRFGFVNNPAAAPFTFTHNDANATCIGNYSGQITINANGQITSIPIVCDGNNEFTLDS